jgi:hypothetical protein
MAKIKKAQNGAKKTPTPTYKNLRMGVATQRREAGQSPKDGYGASKEDSALYRFGYNRGLKGEKEYPGEPPVQKMGRWEGQNAAKKAAPKKKMKSGGKLTKAKGGKQMLKRADGSVSQRGLWDNIRAAAKRNKAAGKPGKKPTAAMLKQERKIKAKGK